MILVKTIAHLGEIIAKYRLEGNSIGFVPTMGALHSGHISLIEASRQHNPVTVCSIFVNPTQFNNPEDFEKYPVTIEKDIDMLEKAGCTVLFLPSTAEMYPPGDPAEHYDLGFIETVLEGKYRPGHFQGVCRIVDKLLKAVRPDILYLGRKDYQQCMVINKMIALKNHPVQLQVCDTVREADGLAMSSRNMRLNPVERQQALHIIKTLRTIREKLSPGDLRPLKQQAQQYLEANGFKVDYAAIADAVTLEPLDNWDGRQEIVALVATFLNEIRLIDNLVLTSSPNT